jgi:hypothetical protein
LKFNFSLGKLYSKISKIFHIMNYSIFMHILNICMRIHASKKKKSIATKVSQIIIFKELYFVLIKI